MRSFAALAVILLLAGCAGNGPSPAANAPTPDDGSAWAFTSTEGTIYTAKSPARNATVLFFMATWCSTCQSKAPIIADIAEDYAGRGVATYSLDFDATETTADLEGWMDRYQQDWPHGIDAGLKIQRLYEVTSQSTVVVLDAEGNVVQKFGYGRVTDDGLRAALDDALSA